MKGYRLLALFYIFAVLIQPVFAAQADSHKYPKTKMNKTKRTYEFKIPDPYAWLENPDSKQTQDWVRRQNNFTFRYLDKIPGRDAIKNRLEELWSYDKYGLPFKRAEHYYFNRKTGLQNQGVLYRALTLDAEPEVVLDPNTFSEDGTAALMDYKITEDGKYLVYAMSYKGSDWKEIFVRDLEAGEDLKDHLKWIKFSSASLTTDGRGFYYGRYAEPSNDQEAALSNQQIYFHKIGTSQSEDVLIHEDKENPDWFFHVEESEDGKYLYLYTTNSTSSENLLYYKELKDGASSEWTKLVDKFEAEYSIVHQEGTRLLIATTKDAPKGRVISLDLKKPEVQTEIIPESENLLESVRLVGDRLFCKYQVDVKNEVLVFDMEGNKLGDVELPGIGSVSGFGGKESSTETFFWFGNFSNPGSIYRLAADSLQPTLLWQPELAFTPDDYTTEQVFYESKDGTRIPMFISYKKGLVKNGENPTILYGYGGFDISITPSFSPSVLGWMEMGGIFAVANLRGGGEYGEEWHEAGTKLKKQNVFDDFIAAAEWLSENDYTNSENLAIKGGSNGGLLVGATMLQRPDLFKVALPAVGVMDMLRFHKFTIGWAWQDDYGYPEKDGRDFGNLLQYSPVHNVKEGVHYPATLITTGDHDDRVVPAHSYKFAAALQAAQKGPNPVLIRIETAAGHGAGKPTSKSIDEAADSCAFTLRNMGKLVDSR